MNKIVTLLLAVILIGCSVTKTTNNIHPFSGDSMGCGNFIVYQLSEDNSEYVSIVVDVSSIDLEEMQVYNVSKADVVRVTRKKYASAVNASLCNDVMMDKPKELLEEIASEGVVEVFVTNYQLEKAENKEPYNVTIVLKKVIFETISIDYLRIENINVGWLPG
ncbi:MAG: hypothetical protein ABJG47_16510 [Ekhidna sp.]